MSKQTIEIIISPDGEIKVEAHGFRGRACERATKEILEKLGGEQECERKPEYYQGEIEINATGQKVKLGG